MVFAFCKQPLQAIYLTPVLLFMVLVRIPAWFIFSLIPSLRPRRSWSFSQSFAVFSIQGFTSIFYDTGFYPEPDPKVVASNPEPVGFVWVEPISENLVFGDVATAATTNKVKPEKISGYWYGARDSSGKYDYKAKTDEKVILAFHGGAHIAGSAHPFADSTPVVPQLLAHTGTTIERAFSLEYRLSAAAPFTPANPFPASLLDAVAGYRYLIEDIGFRPENILIEGCSSGGHIAVQLVMYLIWSQFPSLPPPGALLLISPVLDWAGTHDTQDGSMRRNRNADVVNAMMTNGYTPSAIRGLLTPEELATNVYLSPSSLRLKSSHEELFGCFPPTAIFAGEAEQTVDAMRTLYSRLGGRKRSDVQLFEYPDVVHGFESMPAFKAQYTNVWNDMQAWMLDTMS